MVTETKVQGWIKPLARIGLIAKGVVYIILGALAFMAAFEIGGQTDDKATKQGVFELVRDKGGTVLLGLLIIGLVCYSVWRIIQPFVGENKKDTSKKGIAKKIRYAFSGLGYFSVAILAGKTLLKKQSQSGGSNTMLAKMLTETWGQWLVAIGAAILAGIGIYQMYYALSEKYKKHVTKLNLQNAASAMLLRSGKVGYVARGLVWIMLGWLLLKAMLHSNSNEAGNSGKAFAFLESASYGSYLLGALGFGLICYGAFNFVRSRYEKF